MLTILDPTPAGPIAQRAWRLEYVVHFGLRTPRRVPHLVARRMNQRSSPGIFDDDDLTVGGRAVRRALERGRRPRPREALRTRRAGEHRARANVRGTVRADSRCAPRSSAAFVISLPRSTPVCGLPADSAPRCGGGAAWCARFRRTRARGLGITGRLGIRGARRGSEIERRSGGFELGPRREAAAGARTALGAR